MAKVAFSKLNLAINKEVKTFEWNNQTIEVKQYIPINEKLELCSRVLNQVVDDLGYYNVGKIELFKALETIMAYTNITLTEKQKEDPSKLYDLLASTGFEDMVMDNIPDEERYFIYNTINQTIDLIYEYKNSVYAILDSLKTDYENLDFNATNIQNKLANKENVEFLSNVMDKLG